MKTYNCVAILGVGLIGGSVGLALRARKLAKQVVGSGSRGATLETAQRLGAITRAEAEPKNAVSEAELVVVCAPVAQIVEQVRLIAPACRAGTLITDVGSTKAQIVQQLDAVSRDAAWPAGVHFVGSHPLAGSEKTGPQNASADLFVGRTVIVTPAPRSRRQDCAAICEFWENLGGLLREMAPEEHDCALAATSHLPHLVAAAIAGATAEEYVTLTAAGWQDTTRIAAGDPSLWWQIMLANRENLLASLDRFTGLLAQWRKALEAGDAVEIERLLREAKRIRDAVGS